MANTVRKHINNKTKGCTQQCRTQSVRCLIFFPRCSCKWNSGKTPRNPTARKLTGQAPHARSPNQGSECCAWRFRQRSLWPYIVANPVAKCRCHPRAGGCAWTSRTVIAERVASTRDEWDGKCMISSFVVRVTFGSLQTEMIIFLLCWEGGMGCSLGRCGLPINSPFSEFGPQRPGLHHWDTAFPILTFVFLSFCEINVSVTFLLDLLTCPFRKDLLNFFKK